MLEPLCKTVFEAQLKVNSNVWLAEPEGRTMHLSAWKLDLPNSFEQTCSCNYTSSDHVMSLYWGPANENIRPAERHQEFSFNFVDSNTAERKRKDIFL